LVDAACSRVRDYAMASAIDRAYRRPFSALLLVAGDESFLFDHSDPVTRSEEQQALLDGFIGCPIDDDRIYGAFNAMNPPDGDGSNSRRHTDGAIIINEHGRVAGMGRWLRYPEFDNGDLRCVENKIHLLKGGSNVGGRHRTALRMSMYPDVAVAVPVSETAGTVIPCSRGMIVDDYVWVPPRVVLRVCERVTAGNTP